MKLKPNESVQHKCDDWNGLHTVDYLIDGIVFVSIVVGDGQHPTPAQFKRAEYEAIQEGRARTREAMRMHKSFVRSMAVEAVRALKRAAREHGLTPEEFIRKFSR